MAITLIKGRPGAGKSYECVVHHILPSLKDGRKVVTNIPLNVEYFCQVLGSEVKELIEVVPFDFEQETPYLASPNDYIKYQDWRNDKNQGVLFVLDECHLIFPLSGRGKAQTDLADSQIKFFSGHRHYGFDFIFLTQSDRKINRLIREDIEICVEVRKNRAIGDSSYRRYSFYYGDGKKGGLISQESRKYEQQFFGLYTSHTKSKSEVKEAGAKDLKKWHQSWLLRIGFVTLVFGILYSVKTLGTLAKSYDKKSPPAIASNEPVPVRNVEPKKVKANESFVGLPYGDFQIFIEGNSEYTYKDPNGQFRLQKQYYFSAVNKSKFEMSLKLDDFYLAGYDVAVYSPCMVRLTYGNSSKLVYCRGKSPTENELTAPNSTELIPM